MYRLNNIKQNLLIVAIATLLTGCGGGGGGSTTSTESTTETPNVVEVQTEANPLSQKIKPPLNG